MLCGLYPPTSGKADIMGYNLATQLDQIRSIIGYCPQVDILYDDFNVKEHLDLIASVSNQFFLKRKKKIFTQFTFMFFFFKIKGFPKSKLNDEIDRIATFVGLHKDLHKKSKNLSGGMKRRLMVAMSLIGDSKIIIMGKILCILCKTFHFIQNERLFKVKFFILQNDNYIYN